MRLGEARQWSELADAGIGDQDIDLSLRPDNLIESIEVLQFGDVSLNSQDVAADRLGGRFQFLLPAACYEDVGTFIDKGFCRRQPYSCGAAGHHGDLAL